MAIEWKTVQALYFDLDNTLIDHSAAEEKAFALSFNDAALHRGVYTREALLRRYRIHNDALWEQYRQGHISSDDVRLKRWDATLAEQFPHAHTVPEISVEHVSALYLQHYDHSSVLMEGAAEVVQIAKLTMKFCGLITNGFPEQVRQKLENLGWTNLFDAVVISEAVGVAKPNRRIFEVARDLSGASERELVYVGDNYDVDMVGAYHAGWRTVWFDRLESHRPQYHEHVHERVSTLHQLHRHVLQKKM